MLYEVITLLFADSASQKVRLLMNGRELDDGSYIIDGKTYIPLRELEGLIYYDDSTKTVYYYKPNVHISLIQSSDGKVFGDINKSGKLKFNVFTQVVITSYSIHYTKLYEIKGPNYASSLYKKIT